MKKIVIPILGLGAVVLGVFLSGILDDPQSTQREAPITAPEANEPAAAPTFDIAPRGIEPVENAPATNSAGEADAEESTPAEKSDPLATGILAGRVVDPDGVPLAGVGVGALVLGIVGAGGIGRVVEAQRQFFRFDRILGILIIIFVVVVVIEQISVNLRRRLV